MGASVPGLEPELACRVIGSCRAREPSVAGIAVHGSYAAGRAGRESDLDLAFVEGEPAEHYRTWFEARDGLAPLHVSARCDLSVDVWEEERGQPEEWALGLPVALPHVWLWCGDRRLTRLLGDHPVLSKPGGPPEIEDMVDAAVKMHPIEHFTLARAWTGLTDDEFFWEPFATTWSIRRRGQCQTPNPFGAGEWVADFAIPEPAPVPVTTIAWLYWHTASMPGRLCDIDFLGGTRSMASGWTSPYLTHHPIFTSAAAAVAALRDGWQRLREAIERAGDDQLEAETAGYTYAAEPPRGGVCVAGPPGPAHPAAHFIAGALSEVSHHATQIGALRDFYAWRQSDHRC